MHARVLRETCTCAQMCVLDGKQFCALEEAGRQYMDDEVDACVLTHNLQVCLRRWSSRPVIAELQGISLCLVLGPEQCKAPLCLTSPAMSNACKEEGNWGCHGALQVLGAAICTPEGVQAQRDRGNSGAGE